jgi:LmbE family N-acetylglucosaminyl deacetylase
VTLNSMANKRWQIISDDSVWMYPADRTLSTVELDGDLYRAAPYESCWFLANGDSDVVTRYETKEEAIAAHERLEKKYKLKRLDNV